MKYIFIVNGREDKTFIRDEIQRQIDSLEIPIEYIVYSTVGEGDATRYVSVFCDLHPKDQVCFVACGGDGIVNEVASGLVGYESSKSLGVISIGGTGNDFVKYFKGRDFSQVKNMLYGQHQLIDIIRVNDNYSINVCNFGFDSVVCNTANALIAKGKKNPYNKGVAVAVMIGRFNKINVVADGEKLGGRRILLCTLANGCSVGGEFICAPRSVIDDGLIDICYIRTMSLLKFLRLLPIYTQGHHLDNPKFSRKIIYRRAKHVEVTSKEQIELCLDGEMLPGNKFVIDILPKAINLLVPAAQ